MDPEAPTGGARRGFRRWKRWLAVLVLLPFLVFGLSNLILNSSWFLNRISQKIREHSTLEAHIGGVSWSPWNGATLREIRVEQPAPLRARVSEPLLTVARIRIAPVWRAWLRGRLEARSIDLTSPRLVLPLELVSHFAPPQPPAAAPTRTAPPPADPPPTAPAVAEKPAPAPPPAATPPSASAAKKSTGYIHLSDASFAVVFGGNKTPLVESRGISGSIPVGGDSAESSLTVAALDFIGKPSLTDLRLPLRWQPPLISIGPAETEIAGLKARLGGQLGMLSGLPLVFEAAVPQQPGKSIDLPGGANFQAAEMSGNTRFRGLLVAPASWQADFVSAAGKPVVKINGRETRFDHAQTINVLRNGTLSCVDARIVGDDLSLLGNATLLSDGNVAAVLRIVAPPETTTSIVQQIFPGVKAPPAYSAMATPQRVALDLEAFGSLGNLQFRLGKNGPLVGAPSPPATVTPP